MCNIEVVLYKHICMNCFMVLILSCEFLNSSKENFYNSSMLVCKLASRVFFVFSIINYNPNGKSD
jgi:hypothetical protein